ncbi:hypothetical protein D9615_007320 [Tricholomella constricta]|uniref:NAD-dependent epimerase/dehydratase domain-containing protein n=1 Tax=Tricholomella constricta TaxID=117010 RepID=A0A8H5H5B6_9AGAR|nr:hypothetical protein D9615_007320 [Tricholomella constricta]
MPTISAGDKVLVSGANGFVATWVVRRFLEKGYAVRGTVRSADKGKFLEDLFQQYGERFEVVVVEDITKARILFEGAFDEAVKGVDAIAHTASPFYLNAVSHDELIGPAVNGTVGILRSAVKSGQNVKRIDVTSSCASVSEVGVDKVFSELDWNDLAVRDVWEQGDNAPGLSKYCASKTLAEKAAWEFYEKSRSDIKWDLSVLNPPFVFGPAIHDIKNPDALNTSARMWYETVLVDGKSKDFLTVQGLAYADVRDVAEAHVLALEKEAAGGERIIISAGESLYPAFPRLNTNRSLRFLLDVANALSPSPIPSHPSLPVGYPGVPWKAPVEYDTSKGARILGLKYRTKEELTRDTLADFEKRGW